MGRARSRYSQEGESESKSGGIASYVGTTSVANRGHPCVSQSRRSCEDVDELNSIRSDGETLEAGETENIQLP